MIKENSAKDEEIIIGAAAIQGAELNVDARSLFVAGTSETLCFGIRENSPNDQTILIGAVGMQGYNLGYDIKAQLVYLQYKNCAFIGADKEQLPMTLFLPSSEDPSPSPTYKIAAAYHIVPKKLLLADLLSMEVNSRLPTLVPGASIIVTNNLPLELNGVRVTDPEVFVSKSIVIHRIASPLDFTTVTEDFGGGETASWFSWLFIIVIPVIKKLNLYRFLVFLVLVSWVCQS
ncbi:unnamed protein product [Arabidopsis halleri]